MILSLMSAVVTALKPTGNGENYKNRKRGRMENCSWQWGKKPLVPKSEAPLKADCEVSLHLPLEKNCRQAVFPANRGTGQLKQWEELLD